MKELVSNKETWEAVLLFWNSVLVFLSLKEKKHRWIDLSALGTFVLHWIGILVFMDLLEAKLFVSVLLLSIILIRTLVTRKRKSMSSNSSAS